MKTEQERKAPATDEALMIEYKLGSEQAFRELYERYHGKVYGYLCNRLQSKADANDVFQECFLRLHRFRGKYDPAFPFLPWLFTLCRNALVDHIRARTKRREDTDADFSQIAAREETPSPIALRPTKLSALSSKEQEILSLRYLHGYSFSDVAGFLELKPAGARKLASRAIQKLRKLLP